MRFTRPRGASRRRRRERPGVAGIRKAPNGVAGMLTLVGPTEAVRFVVDDFMSTGGARHTIFSQGTNVLQPGDNLLQVAAVPDRVPVARPEDGDDREAQERADRAGFEEGRPVAVRGPDRTSNAARWKPKPLWTGPGLPTAASAWSRRPQPRVLGGRGGAGGRGDTGCRAGCRVLAGRLSAPAVRLPNRPAPRRSRRCAGFETQEDRQVT